MTEIDLIPPAELVDVEKLRVDGENPNRMSARQFKALKKSIQRWGFVVPIITNRDYLVADGEHRLGAAKDLGMKQVSVVRLPVDDVDRRLLRQVMNKIRGEHDLFLDAEEYYRIVSEDSRDLIKNLLNESDLRIDNLLRLREPLEYSDEELKVIAERFATKVESSRLDKSWDEVHLGEPLTLKCHFEFSTRAEVTKRILAVCEAFGLGVDESQHFIVFDDFSLDFCRGHLIYITGDSGGGKTLLLKAFKEFFGDEAVELGDLEIDPDEVLRLRWIDVSGNIITINDPVKRHNPRQLKVSSKLITMLKVLPRTSERIFPTTYDSMLCSFLKVRERVARVLQNPRINAITFNTFRHWGATMTFHYTKNLLLVQKVLGHKSIQNTVKYTHLIHFKDDEFDVATATTVDEAKDLASTGFDYFTTMNGVQIFRKPKMFEKYKY